jgi:tetratricopeptide (TPR) repeat protein
MKKFFGIFTLIFLIGTSQSQINFLKGSLSDVMQKAKSENKVVMVDVMTDWCKWCVELDNKVYANPQVADFANTNQINFKIDAEKGEGVDFAKKYKISGYPTIMFLDANGNEIDRIIGYYPAKDFYEMMVDYNKGVNTLNSLKAELEKDPNDIPANLKIADKYMSLGEIKQAKECLNKIIEIDPNNLSGKEDDAQYKLASLSDKDHIIKDLQDFIHNNPESDVLRDAYVSLAESYAYVSNDDVNAEKYYKMGLELYPDYDYLRSSYGQYLNGRAYSIMKDSASTDSDLKQGLDFIDKALPYISGTVNEASSYYIQSRIYSRLKQFPEALESINKALKIFDRKLYRDQRDAVEKQMSMN